SVSHLFFDKLPIDAATGKATVDLIIPTIIKTALPELAVVLIILLILSASISTLSSLVLISSSALTIDLLKGYVRPDMNKKQELLTMRILCFVFIILSVSLAMMKPAIILTLMAISWGTVAGVFLGPYIWGLFWKKTTKLGAWSGAVGGLLFSLIYAWMHNFDSGFVPIGGVLAMFLSLALVPLVSLVSKKFPAEHVKKIFE
ncbi:MAG: sodium:solute symporter family transporter, partial [Desulfocucumaceae bacterium]